MFSIGLSIPELCSHYKSFSIISLHYTRGTLQYDANRKLVWVLLVIMVLFRLQLFPSAIQKQVENFHQLQPVL